MHTRLLLLLLFVTVVLALPRFAHQTPDSVFYLELSRFFQGGFPEEQLQAPYAYRVLVPFLAASGPTGSLDWNFALINLLFTLGAYGLFFLYLRALPGEPGEIEFGMLLLVFSFPTFNYASGVLTDPAGFFFFTLATYCWLKNRYAWFSLTACLGVLAREADLAIVLAFFFYLIWNQYRRFNPQVKLWAGLYGLPPILVYLLLRSLFDIPGYFWYPSLSSLLQNLSQPVSWATLILTLLPLGLVSVAGLLYKGSRVLEDLSNVPDHPRALLLSLAAAGLLLVLYSIFTAFMSGRFVWPFYTALIPLSLVCIRRTELFDRRIAPMLAYLR